jgi:hypothetical protein
LRCTKNKNWFLRFIEKKFFSSAVSLTQVIN